ncbi:MAG: glycosyltransferase family 25 protein [Rhizobiaceae bacterium]|nr:glycosyltransferase family 25 protein [Rhizobiaceae bacterium]
MAIPFPNIGIYVINLDRCVERWSAIRSQARRYGIPIIRVPAIDGREIAPEDYVDVDRMSFLRHGGRQLLPGEYGCYRSHLRAISTFLGSSFDAAIIMEDDVEMACDLVERASQIIDAVDEADVIKLFNHRSRAFRRAATTALGDEVGRCLHGPQGSAACYAVTRRGAQRIATSMKTMTYPFDAALERGWFHGANVFTVRQNLVNLGPFSKITQIATRDDYRAIKTNGLKRLPTHLLRMLDFSRRVKYALVG